MTLRRLVRRCMLPAIVVLPAWLLVGWAFFGHGIWAFLGLIIVALLTAAALGALAALTLTRPTGRVTGNLSWTETWLIGACLLSLVWLGFWGRSAGLAGGISIAAYIASFWYEITGWWRDFHRTPGPGGARGSGGSGGTIDIGSIEAVEVDDDSPQRPHPGQDETR